MARTSSTLILNDGDREILEKKVKERTEQSQVVNRARILLLKADGATIESIAERVDLNRNSVILCLKKYKAGGLENALYDAPGRGRNAEITDDERAWVLSIACQKPVDLGYASEVWTYSRLTTHIQSIAEEEASGMMVGQKAIYRSKICEGSRLLRWEASLLPLSAEKRRRPSGVKEGLCPGLEIFCHWQKILPGP